MLVLGTRGQKFKSFYPDLVKEEKMSLPTIAEQVEKLANNKEPVDFIRGLLGFRFLDRVFRNFESYSDEEQLEFLKVLPSQYLPTYPVVKGLLERNSSVNFVVQCGSYWDGFMRYCSQQQGCKVYLSKEVQ